MLESIEKKLDHDLPQDDVQRQLDKMPDIASIRKKMALSFVGIALAIACLGILFVFASKMEPPKVFVTFPSGESKQIRAMAWPVQSGKSVESWAVDAVQKIYTFDFLKAEEQLTAAQPFFTAEGWDSFTRALEASPLMKTVEENKLAVSVTPIKPPIIEATAGTGGNEFAWRVVFPVMVSFTGDTPTKNQYMLMRVLIVRVPTTENPRGLGVQQLLAGGYSPDLRPTLK